MLFVDEAVQPPHRCAVTGRSDRGMLDTGLDIPCVDPHVYISAEGMRQLAQFFKYVESDTHEQLKDELIEARERIAALELEVLEADKVVQAIDVMESHDFRARKRAGRKPVKVAA